MMIGKSKYYCPSCDTIKPISDFGIKQSGQSKGKPQGYCKKCAKQKRREWDAAHSEYSKAQQKIRHQRRRQALIDAGLDKLHNNKKCTWYLNRVVAEEALSKYFNEVERKRGKGYSFICNKDLKISVKSACKRHVRDGDKPGWSFTINQNNIPDYFLCLAFDTRDKLNPQKIWLVPANKISDHRMIWITDNSKPADIRMNPYEKPIDRLIPICNEMRKGM